MINIKEDPSIVAAFMETNEYSTRVLLDVDGKVARKYEVFGLPVSYLIDKNGKVVSRLSGYVDWNAKEIRPLLERLINEAET